MNILLSALCVLACVHFSFATPQEGDIRLAGGNLPEEGRVEIYHAGQWGTVCDDDWDDEDARVVCAQMGWPGAGERYRMGWFGWGSGPIHMDNVRCSGSETRLSDCRHNGWGDENCGHHEDAGVRCTIPGVEGQVRLVGGSIESEGRVEIHHAGEWGTVCDDYWDNRDAAVVCRQLGYSGNSIAFSRSHFLASIGNIGREIWLDNVECHGDENNLSECSHNGWGDENCSHLEDAGVKCALPEEGAVRLVGGSTSNEGRVEIFHGHEWGTVCDDEWGDADAEVVCAQLGMPGASQALHNAAFGEGSGDILLDEVACTGSEASLSACHHDGWGDHNCGHHEDAAVRCTPVEDADFRLTTAGQDSGLQGVAEMRVGTQWFRICSRGWDDQDAEVFCHSLGYPGAARAVRNAYYTVVDVLPYAMERVRCDGNEDSVWQCMHDEDVDPSLCGAGKEAGVVCEGAPDF